MAITPKGLPYSQGYGEAYIFGSPDLSGMRRYTDSLERGNTRLFEEQKAQRTKREKEINDILNKNYELGAQRDVSAIGQATREMRDYVTGQLAGGKRDVLKAGTQQWQKYKEMEDRVINASHNSQEESKWINETIKQVRQSSDPYLDKEKAVGILLDHYNGPDGKKNIFSQDYGSRPNWMEGAFNEGKWLNDFVEKLPQTISETFSNVHTGEGTYIDSETAKGKFFELDENGRLKMQDGKPVVKVTQETAALALQDPRYRRHVEMELIRPENKGKTAYDIISSQLQPFSFANRTLDRKKGFAAKENKTDQKTKEKKEELFTRQELVERTQKNIENQQNALIGGKMPDGTEITDAHYDIYNGRIWLNGGKYSIDVSQKNNGGFEELWNIYNTVPGYKKIDIGDVMKYQGYEEKYPSPTNRIDYSNEGALQTDVKLLKGSNDQKNYRTQVREMFLQNKEVNKVSWDGDNLSVEYLDGKTDRVNLKASDGKSLRELQDLLIKNNEERYLNPIDIDYGNLKYK